ncbi:MAG: hypothetical protein H6737_23625 [Alphaproteobacteria bacterium]|nr:hypothetical protein [Alphaproteobacteria bacterium]
MVVAAANALAALSPFQAMSLAVRLPALLPAAVLLFAAWRSGRAARRVLLAGGLVSAALFFAEAADIAAGGLPWEALAWRPHLGWTVLGAWMWATDDRSRSPRCSGVSAAFAGVYALLGAWIPAVVMLGLDRATRMGMGMRVALGAQALFALLVARWPLEVAERLGVLGLSVDGTTVAAAWVVGGLQALFWAAVVLPRRGSGIVGDP